MIPLILIIGLTDAAIAFLALTFLVSDILSGYVFSCMYPPCYPKESLETKGNKKYIFYLTLMIAMFVRSLFLILSGFNVITSLSIDMIWIFLGDVCFFVVYTSMIVIYSNLHHRLKAGHDYRINSYIYLSSIIPYIIVLGIIIVTLFVSETIFFIIFNHRKLGSSYLINCNIVGVAIMTFMYSILFTIFIIKFVSITRMWRENPGLHKKWRVSLLSLGVCLVSLCYLGRTIFIFYRLITWDKTFEYPVNEKIQIYMYLLLETLPMFVFLVFLVKIRRDLMEIIRSKLRLRRE